MAHDVCGVSRYEWTRRMPRVNLCNDRSWDPHLAAVHGDHLWTTLQDRRVLVLGLQVLAALKLARPPLLLWSEHRGVRWCYAPHPSGLCRTYNDPLIRLAVGLRLEEMLNDSD